MRWLMLALLLVLLASLEARGYHDGRLRVLVVASDAEDVLWATMLGVVLDKAAPGSRVEVLYLSKIGGECGERSLLSDLLYLLDYDAVLVPDFNIFYACGGALSATEISTLRAYAESGGIVVVGLNTLVQSWSPRMSRLTGLELLSVVSVARDTRDYDLVWSGRVIEYNDTFGVVRVRLLEGSRAVARFVAGGPAVVVKRESRGFVVSLLFNPVKMGVEQGSRGVFELVASLLLQLHHETGGERSLPLHVLATSGPLLALRYALRNPLYSLASLAAGYVVLVVLCLLGLSPRSLCMLALKPLARSLSGMGLVAQVAKAVEEAGVSTRVDLERITGLRGFKLRRALLLAEACGAVRSIHTGGCTRVYLPPSLPPLNSTSCRRPRLL